LPKFGFFNPFRVEYQVINLSRLQELADDSKFTDNVVNFEILFEMGAISKKNTPLKVLGNGELKTPLKITAHGFSETAKTKIESVGGTVAIHE
jgi:large subunit ribosomal protein L15